VFVEVVLLSFRSATSRAANGRMRVAHVLAKSAAKEVVTATGSSGGCTMREAGSKTSRPIMAMLGMMPVTECGVIGYAAISAGKRSGHGSRCASIEARSICKIVRFARSVWPSDRGRNGVVRVLLMPAIEQSSATNLLSKLLSWSLSNWRGKPKRLKKALYSARMHVCASTSHKDIASSHLVK